MVSGLTSDTLTHHIKGAIIIELISLCALLLGIKGFE
jgi:hypothetical protein